MQGYRAGLWVAIGMAAAAACKGGDGGGAADVELVVAHRDREILVTVAVPDGWVESPHGSQEFRPADHSGQPGVASWSLWADCYGSCNADAIADNIGRAIEGRKRAATRVVGNVGDQETAAPSANRDVIAEKDLERGEQLAYRVTYTGGETEGRREHVAVYCTHYRPGDDFFVVFEAKAPLREEDEHLDDFLAACESVRIGDPD